MYFLFLQCSLRLKYKKHNFDLSTFVQSRKMYTGQTRVHLSNYKIIRCKLKSCQKLVSDRKWQLGVLWWRRGKAQPTYGGLSHHGSSHRFDYRSGDICRIPSPSHVTLFPVRLFSNKGHLSQHSHLTKDNKCTMVIIFFERN